MREELNKSKNKPYIQAYVHPETGEHIGWKAMNKHGNTQFFGLEFKDSAHKHAGPDAVEKKIDEAMYHGRKVELNKPMPGDVKKSKVYVKDPKTGNTIKVNFGDTHLSIKKNIPARKKSYCARSSGQGNLTDKTSANYWSRRAWNC